MIRTTYPDRICYRPDGVAPDSMAAHVLLANPDGVASDSDARHSSFRPGRNSIRLNFHLLRIFNIRNFVRRHFTLSGYRTTRWERRTFHLLRIPYIRNSVRSDIFRSFDSAYPESIRDRQFRFPRQLILHSAAEFLLKLPDISDRLFEIFCFRYLMSKSPNSPCNPPIIGFLSR